MEKWTLQKLMESAGCKKWPKRWETILEDAMDDYALHGCSLATEQYYTALAEKYGMLQGLVELYQKAAAQISQSETLSRLMVLLCKALQDRQHITEDLLEFSGPSAPPGVDSLGYDMFTGLAICSLADYCYNNLKNHGFSEDVIRGVMTMPEQGVESYRLRHDNKPGYDLLDWFQLAIDGKLFDIGRLQIEVFEKLSSGVCVFQNEKGDQIALANAITLHKSGFQLGAVGFENTEGSWHADIAETDTEWIGYPYTEQGFVQAELTKLDKATWKLVLSTGDPVIGLHIPASGKLDPKSVDESLELIKQFLARYFPTYEYKAFVCHSWLMDPQLQSLLGETSNIVKFNRRFHKLTRKCTGKAVFFFIFHKAADELPLRDLPENTKLEKALKAHYLSGKQIYELTGYFTTNR